MQTLVPVKERFVEALESFVDKVQQDPYVLAALLFGSLAYDQVWEKSDIDLILIGKDERKPERSYALVENGINIHVLMFSRSKFKGMLEGSLQSSFFHSSFSRSTLLFTKDESLRDYYENVKRVGSRDREMQLLRAASAALYCLPKAEKWFTVKHDLDYAFLWILYTVDNLATIETLTHGEVTGREVIQQALVHNPTFFHAVYTDLIRGEKDAAALGRALAAINGYLDDRIDLLFRPVLDYLAESGGIRSATELDTYFRKHAQTSLSQVYEWLADRGIIRKVSAPLRLTEKSRVTVDEAAYYYDGGDSQCDRRLA
jgi:hypothetical protein